MIPIMRLFRWTVLAGLAPLSLSAQSEHVTPPQKDWTNPVQITVTGNPTYFHRHRMEVEGVPWDRQEIYQSSWAGEMGFRISGLTESDYTLRLEYTEMDMNAPDIRVFDILVNDQVVAEEVCIFREVGNRKVLRLDYEASPHDGVIEFSQRKSVPQADVPSFTLLQLFDTEGGLVAERSAYEIRPAHWDLNGYLDKIYFGPILNEHDAAPWEGTYKIRAHETDRLTAADIVGPDDIVYPNWTHVGIADGIPESQATHSAVDFGAIPDDSIDDAPALQAAIEAVEADGGGVLVIPEGTYYLDRPITVTGDHIVLRGQGREKTRLLSRFTMKGQQPELRGFNTGDAIGPKTYFYVWADPQGLVSVRIKAGDKVVHELERPGLWETQIEYRYAGTVLTDAVESGPIDLTAEVTYRDGSTRSTTARVEVTKKAIPAARARGSLSMIEFRGQGQFGDRMYLAANGERGDTHLTLKPGHNLSPGDRIYLHAPTTPEWNKMTRNAHRGGDYRANQYQVQSVDGDRVEIGEPLRLVFPMDAEPYLLKLRPMVSSGIEDLSLEQVAETKVHGILIEYGWECWVRGVEVVRAGYKPLYMPHAKRCEVRDSVFDRVWFNGGGAGYVGWEHSFDSLMENVTTYDMRHAPVVQWATSGCVIRKSAFHNSDAQWHAGWTNENLFEELIVTASQDGGSYGNGGWASGPEDTGHGPNGPRNTIYNCDISSTKVGLWMGGMNENWLITYNRFVVGRGPAILAKAASFDHIIQGNVFVVMEPYPGAIYIGSEDCTGIELINNRFFGPVDQLVAGPMRPAVEWDNHVLPSGNINRPHAPVRSIYDWQRRN